MHIGARRNRRSAQRLVRAALQARGRWFEPSRAHFAPVSVRHRLSMRLLRRPHRQTTARSSRSQSWVGPEITDPSAISSAGYGDDGPAHRLLAFRGSEGGCPSRPPPAIDECQPALAVDPAERAKARVSSSLDADGRAWRLAVRTTIALDDDLVSEAQRLTGTTEKSALVRQALRALIERESARRLARLAGSEPDAKPIPRRQTTPS